MAKKLRDYSIFNKFNFERKPVGVKFLITKPEGIKRRGKGLNFCEMFKEAQTSEPFYVGEEDFECIEPMILGMKDPEPILVSGYVGERENIYSEARANRKIYQYLPKMIKGSVRYVAFAPIDQLTFDPDVLIITANLSQARTILRALGYSSGENWSSQGTPVAACTWLYLYPVLSGKLNFTITGLSFGMQSLKVLPEGLFLISIPWQLLPEIIENLQDMDWDLPMKGGTRDENRERVQKLFKQFRQELAEDRNR